MRKREEKEERNRLKNDIDTILKNVNYSLLSPHTMSQQRVPGYTAEELLDLKASAASLLGKRIVLKDFDVEGNPGAGIAKKRLSTRAKVAIAITHVDFYPTQSKDWQDLLDANRPVDAPPIPPGKRARNAGDIFSKMGMNGNPLVGVVLPASAHAKTDPLAMLARVMAVFPNGHTEQKLTWRTLLMHPRLGSQKLDATQMTKFRDAINWLQSQVPNSPFQIRDLRADDDLEVDERKPPSGAHEDLGSKMILGPEAIDTVRIALEKLLAKELG